MKDEGYEHAHSSPIKTPQQLAVVMVLAFVIPVIGMILLANFVISGYRAAARADDPDAVARRIQPLARVEFADVAAGPRAAKSGEEVYKAVCSACHGTGAAGAWKFGDKAAWAPHIKEGLEALAKNAIGGIRAMPPRGGNPDLSDLEVTRAVVYIANAAGANFKEPAAPAAAAAKPGPAAAERTGEQIVSAGCGSCHLTGEGGAPKVGDRAAWSKRISAGIDKVTASAIRGHGGMPARGGFADLTDPEVRKAILYMFDAAGGKLVPAAATPASLPAKVYFDTGKASLSAEGKDTIAAVVAVLKPTGDKVDVTGYTDKSGNLAKNLELAKDRAKAVREALITGGVAKDRINMKPPVETTGTGTDGEARRVEIAMAGQAAATVAAAPAAASEDKGKATYSQACVACHGQGVAGAPKFGDKTAWAPRIKTGMDALYTTSLKGKGAMPPKGGNTTLADADVKAAVDYMVAAVK
jgi:cytochrome c5